MAPAGGASILHADLDAFYASVEQLLDPSLAGLPIAVGGGVVLAASYEAKAFGVHAGMSGHAARRLCPDLRVVGGHFRDYQRLGDQVIEVLRDFTPRVERISIDEAFCDVAGSIHLFGTPADIATRIRARVLGEIGLPLSVGVARTKHLAKIASQVAKPDGLVVVEPDREMEFLHPLPVGLVWGVGPVTRARLASRGIHTVGDLAAAPDGLLPGLLGPAAGAKLVALAGNDDPRGIQTTRRASSVGAQAALGRRRPTAVLLRATLGYLADRVAGRLRATNRAGRTLTVRVRFADMRSITRSVTVPVAISTTLTMTEMACELARAALTDNPAEHQITLLAVSASNLVAEPARQLGLPFDLPGDPVSGHGRPGTSTDAGHWALDRSVDAIRTRFGRRSVGYATVLFSDVTGVPEEFRELAERAPGRHRPDDGSAAP